jgi:hypothetical protein
MVGVLKSVMQLNYIFMINSPKYFYFTFNVFKNLAVYRFSKYFTSITNTFLLEKFDAGVASLPNFMQLFEVTDT